MNKLNNFSSITPSAIEQAAGLYGTPLYLYDEKLILERCKLCMDMPNAYGLTVRYAMKANSSRALLQLITNAGLHLDASSANEVIRATAAGVAHNKIMLTTQEVYSGSGKRLFEELLHDGIKYNVCSLRQLQCVCQCSMSFDKNNIGIRIHPGIGSGESATRNTGDDYSCFGIHLSDLDEAIAYAAEKGIKFKHIHVHIGSGADSEIWRQNIDLQLGILDKYFPDAESVGFGGGLKEARMPDEHAADVIVLGSYAKQQVEAFNKKSGRKLHMEIEPGTYIVANSGYAVTRLIDMKKTARSDFIITDGGMEMNSRPLLYGSRHPIYIISNDGTKVKSSEFFPENHNFRAVVAGRCCESGDCQTLDMDGHAITRAMAEPEAGDIAVIGGAGAYCSSMAPFNYNSHEQAPEVLYTKNGKLRLIRKRQELQDIWMNEMLALEEE